MPQNCSSLVAFASYFSVFYSIYVIISVFFCFYFFSSRFHFEQFFISQDTLSTEIKKWMKAIL